MEHSLNMGQKQFFQEFFSPSGFVKLTLVFARFTVSNKVAFENLLVYQSSEFIIVNG